MGRAVGLDVDASAGEPRDLVPVQQLPLTRRGVSRLLPQPAQRLLEASLREGLESGEQRVRRLARHPGSESRDQRPLLVLRKRRQPPADLIGPEGPSGSDPLAYHEDRGR